MKRLGDKMDNKNNQFDVARLSDEEVSKVNTLEKSMSDEKGEEIVLIAYKHQDKT